MATKNQQYPHRAVGVGLNASIIGLAFPEEGDYRFHILVDDIEMGVVPLYLERIQK